VSPLLFIHSNTVANNGTVGFFNTETSPATTANITISQNAFSNHSLREIEFDAFSGTNVFITQNAFTQNAFTATDFILADIASDFTFNQNTLASTQTFVNSALMFIWDTPGATGTVHLEDNSINVPIASGQASLIFETFRGSPTIEIFKNAFKNSISNGVFINHVPTVAASDTSAEIQQNSFFTQGIGLTYLVQPLVTGTRFQSVVTSNIANTSGAFPGFSMGTANSYAKLCVEMQFNHANTYVFDNTGGGTLRLITDTGDFATSNNVFNTFNLLPNAAAITQTATPFSCP
jgi:hypothetical protein